MRRFAGSKLSVKEFCRREKVSVPSFYHWRKKLTKASSDGAVTTIATFLPVEVASTSTVSLQAAFPNGSTLTLGVNDPRVLQVAIEMIALARTTGGEA
jgi:hypothetical protein